MSTPPYEGPSTGPKPGEIPEKDPNDEGSPVKSITPERYGDELDDLEAEIVLPFPVDFEDEEAENLLREILGDAYDQERPDPRSDLDSASTSGVEELSDEEKFQEDSQKLIRKDAETNILEEGKIKNEKIFNDATKKKVNKNKCKKSEKMDYEEVNVKKGRKNHIIKNGNDKKFEEKKDTKDLKKEYFDSLEEQRFYEEKDDYDDGDDEEKQSFQENEHGDDDELEHEEKMNDCEEDKDDKKCEDEENDDEEAENRRNILQRILRRRMPGEDALDYLINNEILPIEEKEEEEEEEEESSTDKEDLKNRNIRRKNRVKKQKRHADKNIITTKNISNMSKLGKCLPVSQQRMTDEFKLILEKKTKKEKEMDKSSESEEENNEEFDEMKEGTVDKKIDKKNYCIEEEDDDCLINDGASTSETSENEGEQKEEEEIDLHEKTKRQIKKSPEMLLSAHLIRQKKIASVSSSKRANSLALKNLEVALDQLEEYRIPWCDITKIKTHRPVEGDSSCSSRGPSPDVKQELEEEQTHETSLKAENPKNRRKKVAKRKIKNGSSAINSTTSDDDTPTTSLTATGKANILLNGNRIETNEVNEKNEDLELEKEKNKALRRSRKLFEHEKHLHSSTNNMRKDGKKFEKQMIKELDEIIHKMEGWNEHWKVEGDLMLEEVSTAQKFGRIRHTLPIDSCKQEWVSVVEHIGKEEEEVDERDQMPFVDYDENDVISDVDEEDFTEEIPGTTPFVKNIMRNMGYRYIRKKLKDEHPPEPKKEDYNEWQFREFQDEYERRKADDMFFFTHRYTEDEELEDELVSAAMLQQPCTSNGVTTRYRSGTPLSRVGGSPANNVIIPASREFYSSPQPTLTRNRSGVATSLTNGGTPGRSTPSTVKTKKHEKDDEEEKITLEEEEADEIPASTDIENLNITSSRVQRKQRKVASTTTPSVPEKKIKRNIEKSGKDKDTKPEEGASNSVAHSTKKKSAKVKKSKDNDEPTYCVCSRISFGEMIGCDNDKCEIEWFHFECVSLSTKPKGKWYCPNCRHPEIGPKQMKQFGQSSTAVSNNRTTRQTEKA